MECLLVSNCHCRKLSVRDRAAQSRARTNTKPPLGYLAFHRKMWRCCGPANPESCISFELKKEMKRKRRLISKWFFAQEIANKSESSMFIHQRYIKITFNQRHSRSLELIINYDPNRCDEELIKMSFSISFSPRVGEVHWTLRYNLLSAFFFVSSKSVFWRKHLAESWRFMMNWQFDWCESLFFFCWFHPSFSI